MTRPNHDLSQTTGVWLESARLQLGYSDLRAARIETIRPALEAIHRAAATLWGAIDVVMSKAPAVARVRSRAAALILTRAFDDLNAIATLMAEGLPIQAAALGASLWEKAHTANAVVADASVAEKWMAIASEAENGNPLYKTKHYRAAYLKLAKELQIQTAFEDAESDYKELCSVKHAHPFVLKNYGIQDHGDGRYTLQFGAMTGGQALYITTQCAVAIAGAGLWAAVGFSYWNSELLTEDEHSLLFRSIAEGLDALDRLRGSLPDVPAVVE